MKKDFSALKAGADRNNLVKIKPALINLWLDKNSKVIQTKNKPVGISDCPAPWG